MFIVKKNILSLNQRVKRHIRKHICLVFQKTHMSGVLFIHIRHISGVPIHIRNTSETLNMNFTNFTFLNLKFKHVKFVSWILWIMLDIYESEDFWFCNFYWSLFSTIENNLSSESLRKHICWILRCNLISYVINDD